MIRPDQENRWETKFKCQRQEGYYQLGQGHIFFTVTFPTWTAFNSLKDKYAFAIKKQYKNKYLIQQVIISQKLYITKT